MIIEEILTKLIIFVFPLGQLTRISLPNWPISVYWHDCLTLVLLLIWFLRKRKIPQASLSRPITIFLVMTLISWIFNFSRWGSKESFLGLLYWLRWLAYAGFYFVVFDLIKNKAKLKLEFEDGLIIASTGAAFLGMTQYFFFPDLRLLAPLGWDPHLYRIVGTYLDPGFTGLIFLLGLILVVNRLWEYKKSLKHFWLLGIILYLALAFTYSRSTFLAAFLAAIIIGRAKRSWKFIVLSTLLLLATVFFLPRKTGVGTKLEREETVWARIENYQQAEKIIQKQPLIGVGFNNLRIAKKEYGFLKDDQWLSHSGAGLDNSFLFVWATSGIFGLATYFWLLRKSFFDGGEVIIKASLGAVIAHSFFNNSLFYPWIMLWLWLLLAVKELRK